MNSAIHAQRILEAWNLADLGGFEAALEDALSFTKTHMSYCRMASEQQELLQAVAEHLRNISWSVGRPTERILSTGFQLLFHLGKMADCQSAYAHAAVSG